MAFKSNDRTFEKVYGTFDKRDYFNAKGLAKVQIGNFERALKKNDKGAQQILDKFKGDMGKAKDYITQVITDRKKEQAFNDYKAFKSAVDSIQKGKPQYGAVDLVKSRIHNSSQKYTIALYSALRNKKFTKWKDVHNDVDDLIGESVNENAYKTWLKKNDLDDDKDNKSLFHHLLKKHKSVSKFPKHYRESVNEDKFYNTRVQYTDPKSKKKFVGDVVRKDGDEYKVNLGKDGRFEKYILAKAKDLKIVSKSKKRTYESVNEAMKPSQVRSAISKVKKQLMRKWKQKGGYENFGQKELSQMRDKFDYNPYGSSDERQIAKMLDGFDNWAMNYDGNMREAFVVAYGKGPKPIKPAFAAYADKKMAQKFMSDLKKDGYKVMMTQKKIKGIDESTLSQIHKAAKKGSYPVTIVASMLGKVVKQELVKTPQAVPAAFRMMQGGYPKAKVSIEDRTGKVLFTESKQDVIKLKKKSKSETAFYDILSTMEKKYGSRGFQKWLDKSLKDMGLNPRRFNTSAEKQEALYQSTLKEDLRNWFKSKWVNIGKKDKSGKHPPCGTSGKKKGYAKCVPAAKAKTMSKKEKESATRRKRAAQNKAGRGGSQGGGGSKPINVSTHTKGRKSGTGKGS